MADDAGSQQPSYGSSGHDQGGDEWWGSNTPWQRSWSWWDSGDWNQSKGYGKNDRSGSRSDSQKSRFNKGQKGKGKSYHSGSSSDKAPWAYTGGKAKGKKGGRKGGKKDDHCGQYVRGGYVAPGGDFYKYLGES